MFPEAGEIPHSSDCCRTYTLRLYTSGLIIASEIPREEDPDETSVLINDLSRCIKLLQLAMESNEGAEHAVEHLTSLALDIGVVRVFHDIPCLRCRY